MKMRHSLWSIIIWWLVTAVIALLGIIAFRQRKPPSNRDTNETREMSPAKEKLLNMQRAAIVEIKNGEAAIIKMPDGYLFFAPQKKDPLNGSYKLFFSKTGAFTDDGELLESHCGEVCMQIIKAKGHQFALKGGSANHTNVSLSTPDNEAGIAKVPYSDPNMVDITSIEFKDNPKWDDKVLLDFVKEDLSKR